MAGDRLLTVQEAAERIRSSPESVRRWIRQGRIKAFRPGGTRLGYRIPEPEVERFLTSRGSGADDADGAQR